MNKGYALYQERLVDFKKVLTYHLVSKIKHFKITPEEFYNAGNLYNQFKDREIKYDSKIFELQSIVNSCGLSRNQVAAIFGKDKDKHRIPYKDLIEQAQEITVRKHGTQFSKKCHVRRAFTNCYFLPLANIKSIFDNPDQMKKVLDAESDYYSDRQRCLIFSQLIGKKNSRYKTNEQVIKQEEIDELIENMDDLI